VLFTDWGGGVVLALGVLMLNTAALRGGTWNISVLSALLLQLHHILYSVRCSGLGYVGWTEAWRVFVHDYR
jgi:hypothetical protein